MGTKKGDTNGNKGKKPAAKALLLFPSDVDRHVNKCVQDVLKRLSNLELTRWDQLFPSNRIMPDLEERIKHADIVVIILDTDHNKFNLNTMYELGLAHGLGRNVITIANRANEHDLPFDIIQHFHVLHGNVLDSADCKEFEDRLQSGCLRHLGNRLDIPEEKTPDTKRPDRRREPFHLLRKRVNEMYEKLKSNAALGNEIKQAVKDINAKAKRVHEKTGQETDQIEVVRRGVRNLLSRMGSVIHMKTDPLFCAYVLLSSCLLALPFMLLMFLLMGRIPSTSEPFSFNRYVGIVFAILLLGVSLAPARIAVMRRPTRWKTAVAGSVVIAASFLATYMFQAIAASQLWPPTTLEGLLRGTLLISMVAGGILYFGRSDSLGYGRALNRAILGGITIAASFFIVRSVLHVITQTEDLSTLWWDSIRRTIPAFVFSSVVIFLVRIPWLFSGTFWTRGSHRGQ